MQYGKQMLLEASGGKVNMIKRVVPFLVALIVLTTLTFCTLLVTIKVCDAGLKLQMISMEINDYNGAYVKTNKMTESIRESFAYRESELYNSSDFVVRTFSKANALLKLVIVMALVLTDLYVFGEINDFVNEIKKELENEMDKRIKRRRRRRKQKRTASKRR